MLPLSSRRDIALLGLIDRCVLGKGPHHFREFFKLDAVAQGRIDRHCFQLQEYSNGDVSDFLYPGSKPAAYISHSLLELVSVYNRLLVPIVERCASVSSFQGALQGLLTDRANSGAADWK